MVNFLFLVHKLSMVLHKAFYYKSFSDDQTERERKRESKRARGIDCKWSYVLTCLRGVLNVSLISTTHQGKTQPKMSTHLSHLCK